MELSLNEYRRQIRPYFNGRKDEYWDVVAWRTIKALIES